MERISRKIKIIFWEELFEILFFVGCWIINLINRNILLLELKVDFEVNANKAYSYARFNFRLMRIYYALYI